MARPENAMQVFTLLEKSNCRKCGEKTCLAFAASVFKDGKNIGECPFLDRDIIARFSGEQLEEGTAVREESAVLLKERIGNVDFSEAAMRTGGILKDGRLTVKVLGKDVSIDPAGNFYSDIHIISWLTEPFLTYIINCSGEDAAGNWMSFREIPGASERYPLFNKRCEEGMKRVADVYTDLFDDLVHLFRGNQVQGVFDSDISVILQILPKVPLMICYWKPDDGMESSLNLFFDKSIEANLGNESAFTLGAGLTQMFEKLAVSHGCEV